MMWVNTIKYRIRILWEHAGRSPLSVAVVSLIRSFVRSFVRRSAFGVHCSTFDVRCSMFDVQRSTSDAVEVLMSATVFECRCRVVVSDVEKSMCREENEEDRTRENDDDDDDDDGQRRGKQLRARRTV